MLDMLPPLRASLLRVLTGAQPQPPPADGDLEQGIRACAPSLHPPHSLLTSSHAALEPLASGRTSPTAASDKAPPPSPLPCLGSVAALLRTARTRDGSLDQAKACTLLLAGAAMTMTFVGVLLGSTVWQLVDRIRGPVVSSARNLSRGGARADASSQKA